MKKDVEILLRDAVRFIESKGLYEEFKTSLSPDNQLEEMYYSPKDVDEWTDIKDL